MKNEYYTPDLEDLFIGYECEVLEPHKFKIDEDVKRKCSIMSGTHLSEIDNFYIDDNSIRTPYLSKEDIEKEGFKEIEDRIYQNDKATIQYSTTFLIIWLGIGELRIHKYAGECKSINEFRKICKWLNIK